MMSIDSDTIIDLQKDDIKPAALVLSHAFHEGSVNVYAYPDAGERKRRLPHAFEFVLRYGIRYGKVHTTSDRLEGVAVWLRPEVMTFTFRRMIRSNAIWPGIRAGIRGSLRMMQLSEYIEIKHKELAPYDHWYLMLLGVDPEHQGKGYGGRLLRGMLTSVDEAGLPCYLETTTEENVELYRHFGFSVIDEFTVPDTTVPIWIMLRKNAS